MLETVKNAIHIIIPARTSLLVVMACLFTTAAVIAQDKPATPAAPQANPLSGSAKRQYTQFKNFIIASAEKMPEENYAYKPADTVRGYGQVVGHVADAQYLFCSAIRGEKAPDLKIEQSKTTKPDLVTSLKAAFAYCDPVYDSMTDASGSEIIKFFGNDAPKLGVLYFNNMHNSEHYGNLVTYLRMKGIVPPSSEPRTPPPAAPKK
jgi:uncharacterized damage-inducible protein DinB